MRFADGAVRGGFNAQIAAAPKEGIIVSIAMTDRRNDSGLATVMVDDIARRYGRAPRNLLVDTHYATFADIAALGARQEPVTVFAPPPPEREAIGPAPWPIAEAGAQENPTASSNGERGWIRAPPRTSTEDES